SIAALWIYDLRSAVVIEFLAGCAAASLSTLAFLYFMEPLTQRLKMSVGLPAALTCFIMRPSLARVISPELIGDGGLFRIHVFGLGLALLAMALAVRLPLAPVQLGGASCRDSASG